MSEKGHGIEIVRARSPPIGLYTPQSLPPRPKSDTRAEYRRMRQWEGSLPSTLGASLFASDETEGAREDMASSLSVLRRGFVH